MRPPPGVSRPSVSWPSPSRRARRASCVQRIARLAGPELAARMECGTHHAVCSRLLRRYAALIGRTPRFSIYEPADVAQVLRRVLKGLDEHGLAVEAVTRAITEAKSQLRDASALRASGPDGARIARAWDALEDELARSDALDSRPPRAVGGLMRDRAEIRAEAQRAVAVRAGRRVPGHQRAAVGVAGAGLRPRQPDGAG